MSTAETHAPLRPVPGDGRPKRIGLVGGDYTRRMLMAAGLPGGHQFHLLDLAEPAANLPEEPLDLLLCDAPEGPLDALQALSRNCPLFPGLPVLRLGRDRLEQQRLLEQLDLPTCSLLPVAARAELRAAWARLQRPAVLKPRDPSGRRRCAILEQESDLDEAWLLLGGEPLVLEPVLPVSQELVLTAVRGISGEVAYYPLAERSPQHTDLWIAPAAAAAEYQTEAAGLAGRVLRRLDYVGVLSLRFFVTNRRLVAAGLTPGFHPAGYGTVEGAFTSQYENALRAVLGQPLGCVGPRGYTATLGLRYPAGRVPRLLELGCAQLHLHSRETGGGICRGHLSIQSPDRDRLYLRLAEVADAVRGW